MFCKNCGKELPDGAKFCSGCGTPVAPPAPPIDLEAPVADFMAPPPEMETPPVTERAPLFEVSPAEAAPEAPVTPVAEAAPEAPPAETSPAWPAAEIPQAAPEIPPVAEAAPPAQDTPAAPAAGEPPRFDAAAAEQPAAKRKGGAFAVLGVIAVAAIVALVLLVRLAMGLIGGGGGGKASFVYLNDDDELMYLADLKEKTTALELTDEGGWSSEVAFSPDGKTLYFTNADNTLYKITVAELKKDGRAERVARNVDSFSMLKDGRLLYTESDSGGGEKLSLYDGKESFKLIRDYWDYQLSEDQKTLYYTERDEADGTKTLYKLAMAKDAKGERLLKGANGIYTPYDSGVLVYGVYDDGAADGNNLTVYSCKPGEKEEELVSGISKIESVTVDGGKAGFYYWVEDTEEHVLYDFVTDEKAEEDAATLQGPEPAYPSWRDYEVYDVGIMDDQLCYIDYYYNYHLVDLQDDYFADYVSLIRLETGMTVEEIIAQYGWDEVLMYLDAYTEQGVYYFIYDYAQAKYYADQVDYSSRYEAYQEAEHREYLRGYMKGTTYNQGFYDLYRYDGGPGKDPLATRVDFESSKAADGIFVYQKVDAVDVGKVADVADLDGNRDVLDLLYTSGGGAGGWYQNVGGKESALDFDEDGAHVYGIYALNGKEVVLRVYDGYESSLRAYSIGKDALTFQSTIVEGDDFTVCGADGDALYLFTDVEYDGYWRVGDFCVYRNGKLETLVKEIYGVILLESGTTYVVTDVDNRDGSVEVALLKDNKLTTIGDEIEDSQGGLVFLDSKQVLYVSDGDLMLWDGKESRRVASGVEHVWASAEETYTGYYPQY